MRRGINFDGCWLSTSIGICLNQECKYPSWSDIWWFWLPATTLLIQICVYLSRLLCLNKILNLRRNFSAHLVCLMVLTLCYRKTYFQIEIEEKKTIEEWSKPSIIHYVFVRIFFFFILIFLKNRYDLIYFIHVKYFSYFMQAEIFLLIVLFICFVNEV